MPAIPIVHARSPTLRDGSVPATVGHGGMGANGGTTTLSSNAPRGRSVMVRPLGSTPHIWRRLCSKISGSDFQILGALYFAPASRNPSTPTPTPTPTSTPNPGTRSDL